MSTQAVARQSAETYSIRLGALLCLPQTQLDGLKSRAVRALEPQKRWHYELEWTRVRSRVMGPFARVELLALGLAPANHLGQGRITTEHDVVDGLIASKHAILLRASPGPTKEEIHVVDTALRLLQAVLRGVDLPMWLCTMRTQPATHVVVPNNAGLWGLSRACRQEQSPLAAWCVDVHCNDEGMATLMQRHRLQMPNGSVHGIQLSASFEPEMVYSGATLYKVPRFVAPYDGASTALRLEFTSVTRLLDMHTSCAMVVLDVAQLLVGFMALEALCQRYLRESVHAVSSSNVPMWHHKLLHTWCAKQLPSPSDRAMAPADVRAAHPALWAEVQLAEQCGPWFADALSGVVACQALLFPGGTMEAVRPVYEDAVGAAFYNGCVVVAVEAVLSLLHMERAVRALEVGAGSGGTASSVLPVLESACARYVFTDVSEVFLRQARARFADFTFLEYALLNIDADPRLQGVAVRETDVIISTNCLHATPFMRNTLRHCEHLLCEAGLLVVNEALATSAFLQMTFGMTDGWWLFSESRDPERIGQDSPLLNWRQWQAILLDNGFHHSHCMQGNSFLRGQAVIVAQSVVPQTVSAEVALGCGAHLVSGGLGGLGLLTARLLVEGGAQHLVLLSRSGRVQVSGRSDWDALLRFAHQVQCRVGDISHQTDVNSVLGAWWLRERERLQVGLGIWHLSSAFEQRLAIHISGLNLALMYGPKVQGAKNLHLGALHRPLLTFSLCSSAAALLPFYSRGQASYAAANSWLLSFSSTRRTGGMRAQSIAWGHLFNVGTQDRLERTAKQAGLHVLSWSMVYEATKVACHVLRDVIPLQVSDWTRTSNGEQGKFTSLLRFSQGGRSRSPPSPKSNYAAGADKSQRAACVEGSGMSSSDVEAAVLRVVHELTGVSTVLAAETPLMEAGVDSLAATELASRLRALTSVTLSPTLIFEQPTPREITSHLLGKLAPEETHMLQAAPTGGVFTLALAALVGRWPGGCVGDALRARLQAAGGNAVGGVPRTRWMKDSIDARLLSTAQAACIVHGGFVLGAQRFDARVFGVSSAEAGAMDPQQRLLLDLGYASLHGASLRRATLLGGNGGVFLGIERPDWELAQPPSARGSVYAVTGDNVAVAAGRVSFALGLQGPCASLNTACASALAAFHGASHAARGGESEAVLVLAVSLQLVPDGVLVRSQNT